MNTEMHVAPGIAATADYTTTVLVNESPEEVYNAINNVRAWWCTRYEGNNEQTGGIFTLRFGAVYITSKVVELAPGQKITWQVEDSNKPWLRNNKEWNGTIMAWEIASQDDQTLIRFTHRGLAPTFECFEVCTNAWTEYIQGSLYSLIGTGTGKPTTM